MVLVRALVGKGSMDPPLFGGHRKFFLDHIDKILGTQKIGKNS